MIYFKQFQEDEKYKICPYCGKKIVEPKHEFHKGIIIMVTRICQWVQIIFACVFVILTLGFISVEMEWEDGNRFKYKGWAIKKRRR